MQISFRVDASPEIGTGHVMRCLTLANELLHFGAKMKFISRHLPNYLQDLIEKDGHEVNRIGDSYGSDSTDELPHAHFLGTSQAIDAKQTKLILQADSPVWLIVDHYGIDQRWEKALRPYVKSILIIDDLADRKHNCDLLVDQNTYPNITSRYDELIPDTAHALLGTKFAILRPEFRESRQQVQVRRGKARRICIFFGGMDIANWTLSVLEALKQIPLNGIEVDVVIGANHPDRDKISSLCQEQAYYCHVQTQRMAELLLNADFAIGAGGSSSWERCCLGLPSLTYIVAPNQEGLVHHADHLGLIKEGEADKNDSRSLAEEINHFINADDAREVISQTCLENVDARGVLRIIAHMQIAKLHLRPATQDDANLIFDWRNHPAIRMVSNNSEMIHWEAHEKWFYSAIQDKDRLIYIAECAQQPLGMIRFDIKGQDAEVSLYLAPEQKGRGFGTQLLIEGEKRVHIDRPEVNSILATVIDSNEVSHRLFRRCGYQLIDSKYIKEVKI